MKTSFYIILFITITIPSFAQIDYSDFKTRSGLSCGIPDSTTIVNSQRILDSLESFEIINGKAEYLYDHGWTYYLSYMKWKNASDLQRAVGYWEEGWSDHQDLVALWNLGSAYRPLGECEKALDYTELYLKNVPDSVKVDYKQVYYRYKFCRGKE